MSDFSKNAAQYAHNQRLDQSPFQKIILSPIIWSSNLQKKLELN